MPIFQPMELFWQHGRHFVSIRFKDKGAMKEVHGQV